ncbi:LPS export ABC transporter periplasmic protein LptC [Chitinibacter sp. GC72]|uniref:LPS export ABC transporter periplasmic protein LptC n=1 Tax=Chitinibacter sp. GC72 TaxID=1526917 RepID=UPI0012F80F3D|nr:LPS export ABC transporter periplasmic protein LptC [Chitinibacter sp. GC72]
MLLLLVAALIWGLSRAAIDVVAQKAVSPDSPDMITQRGVLVRFDEQGLKRSELIAAEVRHIQQQDTMLFEQPKLIQTEPGKPVMTVTGERGKSILKASQVWFYGQTRLERAPFNGQAALLIRSRDIWLDQASQQASSNAPVVADMGPHHAEAVGFVADNNAQTLILKSKVKMTYVPTARTALVGTAAQ